MEDLAEKEGIRRRRRRRKLTSSRSLVGMANSGKRNTNTSQFFFTLDKADELTNKHTMFGKVVGNTIYSKSICHLRSSKRCGSEGVGVQGECRTATTEIKKKIEDELRFKGKKEKMSEDKDKNRRPKKQQLMIDLMDLTQLDVDENERPVK